MASPAESVLIEPFMIGSTLPVGRGGGGVVSVLGERLTTTLGRGSIRVIQSQYGSVRV
jgi:hypothetical protein